MAKILVVDDDASNLRLAVTLLEQAGHEMLSAEGGAEGIEAALAHAPDLVLMDVQLPDMDGIAALKRLRTEPRTAALKVVALTALASGCSPKASTAISKSRSVTRNFWRALRRCWKATTGGQE